MKFQFMKSDATLTKPIAQDGCGLTAVQVNGITVQQTNANYEFCYHTGYHGQGGTHYVYIRPAGSTQKVGCSRIFLNGPKQFQCDNTAGLKSQFVNDACEVVRRNQALFLQIAQSQ